MSFVTITPTGGQPGAKQVNASVEPNLSFKNRSTVLAVEGDGITKSLTVNQ